MEEQIKQIEQRLNSLEQGSTVPLSLERSLKARGFLSNDDFVTGQTEIPTGDPDIFVSIPNANKYSMGIAFYADDANTGHVDAYIEPITNGGYQLHIVGTAEERINYIVFLNTRTIPIIN